MQISLKKILPVFFSQQPAANSQIWQQEVVFNKGEYIHIIAPSGSGKTSLVHFLYGLKKDYNGEI